MRKDIAEALAEDPLDLEAILVERLYLQDKPDDLPTLRKLAERFPENARVWFMLARCLEAHGQTAEASRAQATLQKLGGLSPVRVH